MKGCKSDQNTLLRIVSAKVQALYFYSSPPKAGLKLEGCKNWEIPWVSPGQFSFCNTSLVALCPSHFINACKSLFKPLSKWERSVLGKRHFWVLPYRKGFPLIPWPGCGKFWWSLEWSAPVLGCATKKCVPVSPNGINTGVRYYLNNATTARSMI